MQNIGTSDSRIYPIVLYRTTVLPGIELTFFIVAHMVLYIGYVTKIVMTTRNVLSIAEQCSIGASSISHAAHPASRLGVGKRLGGLTASTADPNWPKLAISYDIVLSNKS